MTETDITPLCRGPGLLGRARPPVAAYAAQGPRQALADLRHKILAPFVSLAAITGMLLAAALSGHAFEAERILVVIFLAITIAVGGG
jgi:hypothetical protein